MKPARRRLRGAVAGIVLAWAGGLTAALAPAAAPGPAGSPPAAVSEPAPAAASWARCPPDVRPLGQAAPARDRGLLWRLQRDGRTSYLYGTLHVGRPQWQRPGPRVAAALAASDTLALEVDVDDPALMKQFNDAALAAQGAPEAAPAAIPLPSAALQQRLENAAWRACVPLAALAGLPPLMQAASLTLLDARWLGLDAAFGQERALAAAARARGRQVLSLETLAQQFAAMQPERPEDTEQALAEALQQLEDGSTRRVLARLVDAWERGDLARLERYEDWCECASTAADRAQLQRLNDLRNPHLAAGIAAEHGRGRRVFAAVGALHMTGPAALPKLLAEQGFRVQRVEFGSRRPRSAQGSSR